LNRPEATFMSASRHGPPVRLHNTRTGKVEPFTPADGGTVRMYVCGPTVYAEPHLGHVRSCVVYDTLRRRFRQHGWAVQHVMNITDMAEEIAHKATMERRTIRATARKYATLYLREARRLGCLPPTRLTWASRFLPQMRDDIAELLDRGLAYQDGPNVYLDTRKAAPLGLVSRIRFEDAIVGQPPVTGRRSPEDFILWRDTHDWGECWPAPWGAGRPGWHNQCAAMALRTLGPTLDVHGGGIDLAFPHHDSEAAVAQALTGKPFARFFVHHGHVTVWREKMSKSRGNFVLARQAAQRHGAAAVRLFLLSRPCREPLDYDARAVRPWAELARDLARARRALARRGRGRPDEAWRARADELGSALDDDLDTPRALALLREQVRDARSVRGPDAAGARFALARAGQALGVPEAARPR
jgi:cysteinyl-tRNA synthetase